MQCENATFSHALKMRAAISYHFAQEEGRGSEKWHQDHQGVWLGNPALSHTVSRYMISLQRRKVLPVQSNPIKKKPYYLSLFPNQDFISQLFLSVTNSLR